MELKNAAEKEIGRMKLVFEKLEVHHHDKKASEFFDFAKRYFGDGEWFLDKGKHLEAFEAAIIAWAYIDAGMKLGFFSVPKELKVNFTA